MNSPGIRLAVRLITIALLGFQALGAQTNSLPKLAAANNAFAFKLLKEAAAQNQTNNLFISPYSAATALQIALNGAAGQTKTEIQQVLEVTGLSAGELNLACKAAAERFNSPAETNVILTTANGLWYREGASIKNEFLEANKAFFSSAIKALDFRNVPAAEKEINQWASDQTHGRITGIADGIIHPVYTDMVLANAVYFRGAWLAPFNPKLTKERIFHPQVGGSKTVPMMERYGDIMYREGTGYQGVRLPYMDYNLALYVFLPAPGSSPAKLVQIMNGDNWRRITMPGFSEREGWLVLPRFKLETTTELVPVLQKMGMKSPFNDQNKKPVADFSRMFSDPHYISVFRQRAFIEVNEKGTEAAALSALGVMKMGINMNPPKPFQMIVDRSFLFAIVDARSEMILFLGIVRDL
jgi:serpin B